MQIHMFYCSYSCTDAAAPIRSPIVNVCSSLHWWLVLFVRKLIILHRFTSMLIQLTVWLLFAWLQHCVKLAKCVLYTYSSHSRAACHQHLGVFTSFHFMTGSQIETFLKWIDLFFTPFRFLFIHVSKLKWDMRIKREQPDILASNSKVI